MIHVFFAEIPDQYDERSLLESLPEEWKIYLDGIKNAAHRRQSLYVRVVLLAALRSLDIKAEAFARDENGRWRINENAAKTDFSLSHSENAVAVAIYSGGTSGKVGVDAERVTDRILKLKTKIVGETKGEFSAEELTRVWTEKESSYKAGLKQTEAYYATKNYEVCGEKYAVTVAFADEREIKSAKFHTIKDCQCIPFI